jgi:cytochrome c-type biogenesis protein CcmH/NrfF
MLKLRNKIALATVFTASLAFAQSMTDMESPAVLRVADKLRCSCGCNLTRACKMEGDCGICRSAKAKILAMQTAGKSDADIVDSFAQSEGKDVLAVRPGPMGVIGPWGALGLGMILVVFIIRRFMKQPPTLAPAGAQAVDSALLDRYRDRIDKDLEKLG